MGQEVGPEGFEPSTNGLKGRCSTAELQTRSGSKLYLKRGVNAYPRPMTVFVSTPIWEMSRTQVALGEWSWLILSFGAS